MSLPIPLRPDLEGAEPYGAPQLEVATVLNVNENPYPPSKQIAQEMGAAIAEAALGMNRYPDREAAELRADLAAYLGHGLDVKNVWVANGSNEVMQQLCTAFGGPGRKLLTFTPTYSMYPEYARNTLTEYVTRPRREDHTVDVELILGAIGEIEPDMVVLARPNNPTGTGIALEVIEQVCRQEPSRLFIVDEAYQEFSDDPSAVELLGDLPNLVVSRTMSKAFALAGGRVGYLAASPAIVDACRIVRLPYHLSAQTQIVARVALRHAEEMLGHVKTLVENREEFTTWAREQGFDVVDSQSNFVLLGTFQDRHAVWQELLDRGVLIRETGPEGFLRASAGTAEEMAALKTALLDIKNKE